MSLVESAGKENCLELNSSLMLGNDFARWRISRSFGEGEITLFLILFYLFMN
jgi:hypothetical protein